MQRADRDSTAGVNEGLPELNSIEGLSSLERKAACRARWKARPLISKENPVGTFPAVGVF